jgi:hypothetical protein
MTSFLRRFNSTFQIPIWTVPVTLLLICLASYSSMPSKLGLYWDDWFITWYIHFLGPSSFIEAFGRDRPLLGWLYVVISSLVGESPIAWQFFAIFARWLGCLALWWTLRGLWPRRTVQAAMVSFLFAVYPGFSQQYIAISYSFHLLVLALTLFSLGLMIWSLRIPNRFLLFFGLSIISAGLAVFTMEYYFGLELLRPLFLWLILIEMEACFRERLKRLALYWSPYVILLVLFLVWRIETPTTRGRVNVFARLGTEPLNTVIDVSTTILRDMVKVSAQAWGKVLDFSHILTYEAFVGLRYVLIVIVTALLCSFFLVLLSKRSEHADETSATRKRWAFQAILIGIFALLVGGVPFWVTGLQISLSFTRDRFTLPMMFGVSLLLAGLVMLIPRFRIVRFGLLASAVGLACGLHYQTALTYRFEWLLEKDFFWELTWRIPNLKPGTTVLTSDVPFLYDWDNSLTAPLNWTYAPDLTGRELPYQLYNVETRLGQGLPGLEEDTSFYHRNRLTPFEGSTSQVVVVFYRPPACLKMINPSRDERLPDKPRYFRELVPFSRPDMVLIDQELPARPPEQIFGPEPEPNWCYYFEKAELAVQFGEWEKAATFGDQALQIEHEIYRRNAVELTPFIEAYAHTGRWEDAVKLSIEAYQAWENMRLMLCDTWRLIQYSAKIDSQGKAALEEIRDNLQCSFSSGLPSSENVH